MEVALVKKLQSILHNVWDFHAEEGDIIRMLLMLDDGDWDIIYTGNPFDNDN